MSQPEILIGSIGWQHTITENGFFPEDLPFDWKLSYYANEFRCVSVCATLLLSLKHPDEWLDDIPDNFLFCFTLDENAVNQFEDTEHLYQTILPFIDHLGGISFLDNDAQHWYQRLAEKLSLPDAREGNYVCVEALADTNKEVRNQLEDILNEHASNDTVILAINDFETQWHRMLEAQIIADFL